MRHAKYEINEYVKALLKAHEILGSYAKIGAVCGVTTKAVEKWRNLGKPPRTEYTGETQYAAMISKATKGAVPKKQLLPDLKLSNKAA